MSRLTNTDIATIKRQSDVISRNLRENNTNFKNAINDCQDQIDNISTGASNAETVQARPYNTSLNDRINQKDKGKTNYKVDGGAVTINVGDTAKVDISEFTGTIDGIEVVISAGTSATISASASTKHRVMVVVGNLDNTFSLVDGAEYDDTTLDPVFPAIAQSQIMLACIYVDDTASVDVTNHIYELHHTVDYPNHFFKGPTRLFTRGNYTFGNIICDRGITFDGFTINNPLDIVNAEFINIYCKGNFIITSNGSLSDNGPNTISENGKAGGGGGINQASNAGAGGLTGYKIDSDTFYSMSAGRGGSGGLGDTYDVGPIIATGGGGGGGAGSIFSAGGAGGVGGDFNSAPVSFPDGTLSNTSISMHISIIAQNITINGNISNDGADGNNGTDNAVNDGGQTAGNGGAGGNSGGSLFFIAKNDFTNTATIDLNGGDGGDGGTGNATTNGSGGGGGGGGAGGFMMIRSLTYTHTGSITMNGGLAGTGGTATGSNTANAGTGGTAGTAGALDQELYNDNLTDIHTTINPSNVLNIGLYNE